ncbi:NAD(P)H-hydrate dehydratase [Roseinatronobacter sp. NSM]|uniref:NAD(P)H-hydrate dehydratase n=1 Tax=Roseinatronobacter sp. NSM TaxID=3457785 RepID=UPI0040353FBC
MVEILTSAQMRAVERAAIDSGAVTGLELMEHAGQKVVGALLDHWNIHHDSPCTALILCGPGNNGGDGFVVARLLAERGWRVTVCLYGDAHTLPRDARHNYDRWARMGAVHALTAAVADMLPPEAFVIDALFGTGLTRALPEPLATALAQLDQRPARGRVAVDAPSGVCLDSGRALGYALPAELTVTFHRAKIGHYLAQGPQHCGALVVADIGLGQNSGHAHQTNLLTDSLAAGLGKRGAGHKYTHGHALVLAGGVGKGGAARLAARAALRMGAGVVTLACPPAALQENACRLDAVMLRAVRDADAVSQLLQDARVTALCLGPGGGVSPREAGVLRAVLDANRPTVLDADALTLLAQGAAGFDALGPQTVLTPHAGEFARLFPDIAAKLQNAATRGPAYSKRDATYDAARRAGCVVVFKGPDTVIAAPDGRCALNGAAYDRAVPWLATAGSGDVLAGMIAGLLARGVAPFDAACAAAWLHVETALHFGAGLIAEDLPETLPQVLNRVTLKPRGTA